jgi:hypothetical protein
MSSRRRLRAISEASGRNVNRAELTTQVAGQTVKIRFLPLTSAQLPRIPGANVSGVKLALSFPQLGDGDSAAEEGASTVWINVRQGRLIMAMALIGTDEPINTPTSLVQITWNQAQLSQP